MPPSPPCCPECGPDPLATFGQVVTWLLVIAGWYAVHVGALRRARRQEDLDAIRGLEEQVVALRSRAIEYHTGDAVDGSHSRTMACDLRYDLQELAARLKMLRDRRPAFFDLTGEMMALRIAITSKNFDSANSAKVPHDDQIVGAIWVACGDIALRLREEFQRKHEH